MLLPPEHHVFGPAPTCQLYYLRDIRRASDTINPRAHNFVMVHSPETGEEAHAFWYAQVIGIFHAVVRHTGPRSHNPHTDHPIEFLWVRWLGVEPGHRFGRRLAKLPKLGFVPDTDPYAFGFLDPSLVIRGAHIIPTFAGGKTSELLVQRSMTLGLSEDWANFYVNIFVDLDMFFRHIGFGIGHLEPMPAPEETVECEQDDDLPPDDYDAEMNEPTFDLINLGSDDDDDDDDGGNDDDDGDDDDEEHDDNGDADEDEDNSDEDVGYAGL
ncbi:hypothetical protein D9615_010190 [Tricholomella constricta]|uniref:Uncharacterized protein n=1 Tax=Tricholomella constricta TaxID=117010 RepID=A0A8H5GNT9_9AGAR|nr:hypothetical protein D9615_010190 [Tricholomella constricta]